MNYKRFMAAIFCMAVTACSSTTMIESKFDSSSKQYSKTVYTKYYDAGDWLSRNHLGASVVADHMKRRIPVVYGVQQSLGALGPGDLEAQAQITIYLWNFDEVPHSVTDIQLSFKEQALRSNSVTIKALPRARTRVDLGAIEIFNYEKKIPVTMKYIVDGKMVAQKLTLHRRTEDELKVFYGPKGKLPYPWSERVSELN